MDEDQAGLEENNKLINEEYKIWKKNAPFLYDVVVTHAFDWPSLTVQWFPDVEGASDPAKPYTTHRLLTGTHTSDQSNEYLQIATVHLPKRELPDGPGALDRASYDDERGGTLHLPRYDELAYLEARLDRARRALCAQPCARAGHAAHQPRRRDQPRALHAAEPGPHRDKGAFPPFIRVCPDPFLCL